MKNSADRGGGCYPPRPKEKDMTRKLMSVKFTVKGGFWKVKKFNQWVLTSKTLITLHVHGDARFSVGFLCRCCTANPRNFKT